MHKILEIGGGTTPYFLRYDIPWAEPDEYYCLDIDLKRLIDARIAIEKKLAEGINVPKTVEYVNEDAVQLPFSDGSFDRIVLSNVLSAPMHRFWDNEGNNFRIENFAKTVQRPLLQDAYNADLFYPERKKVVDEAIRVLKKNGKLIIYTDLIIFGQHSYDRLIEELRNSAAFSMQELTDEQKRIDTLNWQKVINKTHCYCFLAELLPKSSVLEITKAV